MLLSRCPFQPRSQTLRDADDAARRIAAVRAAAGKFGVPLVINARIDTWITLRDATEPERMAETLRRARVHIAAGADVIYPIGASDPHTIRALCAGIDAPVNLGARADLPDLAELGRLGVKRVSTATRLATIAMSAARDAARHLRDTGRFDGFDSSLSYDDAQQLFADS